MSCLPLPKPIMSAAEQFKSSAGPLPRLWPDLTPAHQQQLAQRLAELLQRSLKGQPPQEAINEPPHFPFEQ